MKMKNINFYQECRYTGLRMFCTFTIVLCKPRQALLSTEKWKRNLLLLPWFSPSSNISTNYYFIFILPQDMNGSVGATIHWAWLGSRWKWCLNLKQLGTSARWCSIQITCSPRMYRWVLAECIFTSLLILIARSYSFSHFHFLIKTNKPQNTQIIN